MNQSIFLLQIVFLTFIWSEIIIRNHLLFKSFKSQARIERIVNKYTTRNGKPYFVDVSYVLNEKKEIIRLKKEDGDVLYKEIGIAVSKKNKKYAVRDNPQLDLNIILGTLIIGIVIFFSKKFLEIWPTSWGGIILFCIIWYVLFPDIYFAIINVGTESNKTEYLLKAEKNMDDVLLYRKDAKEYISTSLLFAITLALLVTLGLRSILDIKVAIGIGIITGCLAFSFRGFPKLFYVRKYNRLLNEGKIVYATVCSIKKKAITGIDKEVILKCSYNTLENKKVIFKKSFELVNGSCEIVGKNVPVLVHCTHWEDYLILYDKLGIVDHLESSYSSFFEKKRF